MTTEGDGRKGGAGSAKKQRKGGYVKALILTVLCLFAPVAALAGDDATGRMNISIGGQFGGVVLRPKVKPVSAFKDRNIVKQAYDYSCGAASTATLFNYYLESRSPRPR